MQARELVDPWVEADLEGADEDLEVADEGHLVAAGVRPRGEEMRGLCWALAMSALWVA